MTEQGIKAKSPESLTSALTTRPSFLSPHDISADGEKRQPFLQATSARDGAASAMAFMALSSSTNPPWQDD